MMQSNLTLLITCLALVACTRRTQARQDGADTDASSAPRVVSVGSANTETVYALGHGADVVAVDTSSLFPPEATKLPQVGYQRALSAEGILALRPTLVLVPAEGGPPDVLAQLRDTGLRVETVDVSADERGTTARIERIAELLGADAKPLVERVRHETDAARERAAASPRKPKVLVLYARGAGLVQAFGRHTAADRLLELAHAENAAQGFEGSKPITAEAVASWAPEWVLVPARGLESLGGKDGVLAQPGIAQTPAGKAGHVAGIDDLLLLGFGPRLGEAVTQVARQIHETP